MTLQSMWKKQEVEKEEEEKEEESFHCPCQGEDEHTGV